MGLGLELFSQHSWVSLACLTSTPWLWMSPVIVPHLVIGAPERKSIHGCPGFSWPLPKMAQDSDLRESPTTEIHRIHCCVPLVHSVESTSITHLHCVCRLELPFSYCKSEIREKVQISTWSFCIEISAFTFPVNSNSPFRSFLGLGINLPPPFLLQVVIFQCLYSKSQRGWHTLLLTSLTSFSMPRFKELVARYPDNLPINSKWAE